MKIKPTSRPWKYHAQGDANHYCLLTKDTPPKWILSFFQNGEMSTPQGLANAEFIARACNAHDDMVAALHLILSQSIGEDWTARQAFDFMRETARAALKKVESES